MKTINYDICLLEIHKFLNRNYYKPYDKVHKLANNLYKKYPILAETYWSEQIIRNYVERNLFNNILLLSTITFLHKGGIFYKYVNNIIQKNNQIKKNKNKR